MRLSTPIYLVLYILSAHPFSPPIRQSRRDYSNPAPAVYIGAAKRSGNEVNPDTRPPPQFNSNDSSVALTKALQLNFTDALSKFHPNGSYKNTLELPDINNSNLSESNRCRWPQIGQRIQIQVYKQFISKTSSSHLSFWVHDQSNGLHEHCVNNVPPGWNLLQRYLMMPCLNNNITWELQGEDASLLLIREYIGCKGDRMLPLN
ncbi:MAG: hypothetical protein L6R40_003911 [Gallowayella cf. fulva]|nr:MAG: hypothetical protein L6R40_003911 [Xanthomendoza cf. fulva]